MAIIPFDFVASTYMLDYVVEKGTFENKGWYWYANVCEIDYIIFTPEGGWEEWDEFSGDWMSVNGRNQKARRAE